MSKIQFNNVTYAGLENLKVCSESPFSYVEYMLKDFPEDSEISASPLLFCVSSPLIDEALNAVLSGKNAVVTSDGREMLSVSRGNGRETAKLDAGAFPTLRDVFRLCEEARLSLLYSLIDGGVFFETFDGVVISPFAVIGKGTLIRPGTRISGNSVIGKNCVIGPNSAVEDSTVDEGSEINASFVSGSVIGKDVKIGPFSRIRPGCSISCGVRIGDFVEVKNSVIGENTHAAHLTYIGDSDVGRSVNFGCGTVTSNYDGKYKYRTVIGDNVFVGCNANLVAPVNVGNGSFIAAGSTIVSDVPENSLAIARERQTVKEEWAKERRKKGLLK